MKRTKDILIIFLIVFWKDEIVCKCKIKNFMKNRMIFYVCKQVDECEKMCVKNDCFWHIFIYAWKHGFLAVRIIQKTCQNLFTNWHDFDTI